MLRKRSLFCKVDKKKESVDSSKPLDVWDRKVLEGAQFSLRSSIFGKYGRVVSIAVDDQPISRKAFEYYLLHVWKPQDLVILIHCTHPPSLPVLKFGSLGPPVDDWMKIMEAINKVSRQVECEYTSLCYLRRIKNKMRITTSKNIGETLCHISQEEGASLVVCGSKGQSHLFKGSIPDYLLKHSPVPVLVVTADHNTERNLSLKYQKDEKDEQEEQS